MTCSEFKESAWAYALGALDASEREELERHVAQPIAHQGCQGELNRALRTVSTLGEGIVPVQPPRDAWSKIESQLAGQRPDLLPIRRTTRWAPWAVSIAAAAVCLLAIGKGLSYRAAIIQKNAQLSGMNRVIADREACRQELEAVRQSSLMQRAALAMLEEPATRLVPLGPTPGSQTASHGNALFNPEQQKAMVMISALAPAVGKDYELWIIRDKKPIAAGLLKPGRDGKVLAEVDPKLVQAGRFEMFAVTLEPLGGSAAPTTSPFLAGRVEQG